MKKKNVSIKSSLSPLSSFTTVYVSLIMFGLPVVLNNSYFNITETKSAYFYIVSLIYISVSAITAFVMFLNEKKKQKTAIAKPVLSCTDVAMAVFIAVLFVSSIASSYSEAWTGKGARYQGFITMLVYVLVYVVASRFFRQSQSFLLSSVAALGIVSVLGVLHCYGIDPFYIQQNVADNFKKAYISTVGNINFYSSYLCLLLPVVICGFCTSKKTLGKVIYTATLIAGYLGMMVTSSESFVIGFGAAVLLMIFFFIEDAFCIKRFAVAMGIMAVVSQLYAVFFRINGGAVVPLSKLLSVLTHPAVTVLILIFSVALYLFAHRLSEKLGMLKKFYIIFVAVFITGTVSCFVLSNTVGLGKADSIFRITDAWGSYRGRIWQFCAEMYAERYTFIQKLIGTGPETLHKLSATGELFENRNLDQAHNEYLQYLMTTGIAGLAAYLGLIGTVAYTVIKKLRHNILAVALFAGLFAYWIQAVVNIAQPFSTPIMYVYIACIAAMAKAEMPVKNNK